MLKINKNKIILVLGLFLTFFYCGNANATIYFEDDFDSYIALGPLSEYSNWFVNNWLRPSPIVSSDYYVSAGNSVKFSYHPDKGSAQIGYNFNNSFDSFYVSADILLEIPPESQYSGYTELQFQSYNDDKADSIQFGCTKYHGDIYGYVYHQSATYVDNEIVNQLCNGSFNNISVHYERDYLNYRTIISSYINGDLVGTTYESFSQLGFYGIYICSSVHLTSAYLDNFVISDTIGSGGEDPGIEYSISNNNSLLDVSLSNTSFSLNTSNTFNSSILDVTGTLTIEEVLQDSNLALGSVYFVLQDVDVFSKKFTSSIDQVYGYPVQMSDTDSFSVSFSGLEQFHKYNMTMFLRGVYYDGDSIKHFVYSIPINDTYFIYDTYVPGLIIGDFNKDDYPYDFEENEISKNWLVEIFEFLFVPRDETIQKFMDMGEYAKNKIPMGYLYLIKEKFNSITYETPEEFDIDINFLGTEINMFSLTNFKEQVGVDVWNTYRLLAESVIWLTFVFYIVNRSTTIFNKE